MRQLTGFGSMIGGLLLGVALSVLVSGAMALPFGLGRSTLLMEQLPAGPLGRLFFGPAGPRIVADSRERYPLVGGVEFYPQPALVNGANLCHVQVHHVSGLYFQGIEHEAVLDISDRFGLLPPGGCAIFRDFGNLFRYIGAGDPVEAVAILTQAQRSAQSGRIDFAITCQHRAVGPCDGSRTLSTLSLRDMNAIEAVRHERVGDVKVMTHRYWFHLGGNRMKPPNAEVIVRTQTSYRDPRLLIQDVRVESHGGVDLDLDG